MSKPLLVPSRNPLEPLTQVRLSSYYLSHILNRVTGQAYDVISPPSPSSMHYPLGSLPNRSSAHHAPPSLPTWETLRTDGSSTPSAGLKRSHDYNMDDFFSDVKKRRVTPSYDSSKTSSSNVVLLSRLLIGSYNLF